MSLKRNTGFEEFKPDGEDLSKRTSDAHAKEAYSVLTAGKPATRRYGKSRLKRRLQDYDVYELFLKLCLEFDQSENLKDFRKGLLLLTKALGLSKISRKSGLSRLTIYRMLEKKGNPRLLSFLALFRALGIHFWIVNRQFMKNKQKVFRPKDQPRGEFDGQQHFRPMV